MPFSLKKILHVWCLLLWLSYLLLQNTLTAPNTFNYDTDTCLVQTLGADTGVSGIVICFKEGDIGGYSIPQYHEKNWQIPCQKLMKYRYRIYDHLTCLFISSMNAPAINLSHRVKTPEDLKLISTMIKKPRRSKPYQFHHRLSVRNCVIIYHFIV